MKWTYDWLKDYLKTDATASEIADTLTQIGLEVDDVIAPKSPIVARIVECKPHENSDHLHVLMVDDGSGTLRQVVCGAPNARVGLISALAIPGCIIDGHEIQSGKLRGVLSDGMMCSGKELGINDDHSGIIELPDDSVIGSDVLDAKTVFDAGITPNRPDYLSVRGIARDLSAAGIGEYIEPNDTPFNSVSGNRQVILKTDKCRAYKMIEIHGITVNPSDKKIASRLAAIGINPKNAPVDATNYICYDMAQPMHCFDADEIDGDIVVRMANNGEKFTDLFGNEHELVDTDMVITDASGILALAGVIGGARGATTDDTKNIILESAYFDPVSVRKSAKRLGISTDASYRYERGIDPTITGAAAMHAAQIIMDTCGGKIIGTFAAGTDAAPEIKIAYNPNTFLKKTGIDMAQDIQRDILVSLGYTVDYSNPETWIVTPCPARVDVEIPETIVADLLRIHGYEKIGIDSEHTIGDAHPHDTHDMDIKVALASRGLNECRSFGFGNEMTEQLLSDKPNFKIANPITADYDTLRNGLLFGLLLAVSNNEKRGYPDLNLFELGTVFDGDMPGQQHTSVCIVRTGSNSPKHWTRRNRDVDIYDVKADLIALMQGQRFTVSSENAPRWAHPYRYGALYQGKKKIAEFGELHPSVAKKLRIKTNVVIAIVDDIANLPAKRGGKQPTLSEFQPITRDFAFIVDFDTPAEKLTSVACSADARITNAIVFDAFDMGDGTKSIAFTITIQPTDNMSDSDLQALQTSVINSVEKKCNARIRDK
ncbi:MAG: phenylalanine--tRNA ligase subunit beta [Alphaproteobacteria bacterium]|nr:phenylalanine--tRNA ligase subunit beta [Alphaproteobacteria bacterium]